MAGLLVRRRASCEGNATRTNEARFPRKANLCNCFLYTPPKVHLCGDDAPWRDAPLTHAMLLAEIHRRGFEIPPLLLAPWVDKAIFRPDWLHAADLGVTPRLLGNRPNARLFARCYTEGALAGPLATVHPAVLRGDWR